MAVAISRTADPAGAGTGTTVTYSAVSIGAAEDDRIIVVCVGTELNSGTPSSATLNYGTGALAMNATSLGSFGAMGARIFWLPAPTGTTADIAVTFGASQAATTQHLCVYRVVGAAVESSGVNTSTDMDSTAPLTSGSITIRGSGGFIGIAVGATDAVGKTWANATEDLDEDAGAFQFTTATRVTALTATAVTCTGATNGEDGALAWILLRPGVIAEAGAYALTGTAATVKHAYAAAADAGSYALTGTAASVKHGWKVAAGAGSYAITGSAATLLHKDVLAAAAGSYSLNGSAASVLHGWRVSAGSGSYALTGSDATLTKAAAPKTLTAGAGSYSLTGASASVLNARKVAAGAGGYSLAGTSAALLHKWKLAAGASSYSLTGLDATLTRAAGKFITVDAGSYSLTGNAASLIQARLIAALAGSYSLAGSDGALIAQRRLAIEVGAYVLTGSDAEFASGIAVPPDTPMAVHYGIPQASAFRNPTGGHLGRPRKSSRNADHSMRSGKSPSSGGFLRKH